MPDVLARPSRLTIGQLHTQYLVSSQHPAPEGVRARLDEALARRLPDILTAALGRWLSPADPGIWLIQRLELDLAVNAAWEEEQIAGRWAAQFTRELAATLGGGEDGQNVLHFADYAAYLARFLFDLAEGRAWNKWIFKRFAGLRMLPVSAALRTALTERPEAGLAALLHLTAAQREKVLAALTSQDARRILASFAAQGQSAAEEACLQAAWAIFAAGDRRAGQEPLRILHLYLQVCAQHAELSGPTLQAAIAALLRLARHLEDSPPDQARRLLAALRAGSLTDLYQAAGAIDGEAMAILLRGPPAWRAEVEQTLSIQRAGRAAVSVQSQGEVRYTPFGGLFLLLPRLDALPLAEAAGDWPDLDGTAAPALLRFLILIKACGHGRAQRLFGDPLARGLLGIDPALTLADVARWQAQISEARRERLLHTVADWQRRQGMLGDQIFVCGHVAAASAPVAVLLDARRGVWRAATGYRSQQIERLVERLLPELRRDVAETPPTLIADNALLTALRIALPDLAVLRCNDQAVATLAETDSVLAGILARLDKLPADLAYLASPRSFQVTRPFDLALSVVAQGVLRDFAWRLPGFAGSGLPYLFHNFLDCAASLEDEPERHVVRLGRPPLNLVLAMTGMARVTYRLGWGDDRPWVLFQEG